MPTPRNSPELTPRYADPFLNALMDSHQVTSRAEMWYNNALVGALNVVAGSVTGDRGGSVRRTASLTIDPNTLTDATLGPRLNPYGSRVRVWRGIRYPSGIVEEVQVFFGRIESVDKSLAGVELRCSDLAADVMDARFITQMNPTKLPGAPTKVLACIKALVTDVHAGIGFDTTGTNIPPDPDPTIRANTTWAQERGDALDGLATQLKGGCEWYIESDPTALPANPLPVKAHVHPLPAVITGSTPAVWVIDSGDEGVLVERTVTQDRSGVYNGLCVSGEAIGGENPAHYDWMNDAANGALPTDPMLWGGPFGKVVGFYTGQNLDPNDSQAAKNLAKNLGLNSLAHSKSVAVTCIPNPKLRLGDVVRVTSDSIDLDGMYFVQSFVLPLDPETAMTMTLLGSIQVGTTLQRGGGPGVETWRWADLRVPEGASWRPAR